MTETNTAHDPLALWAQICDQHAARNCRAEEVLPANKAALFDPLALAGIAFVVVAFDGSGDEGQIESVDAFAGGVTVDFPSVDVEIATPSWDGSEIERRTLPLAEAVEKLAYALLEETHGGWEVNEGAHGEFSFDVAERTISLDYNERLLTSQHYGHEW